MRTATRGKCSGEGLPMEPATTAGLASVTTRAKLNYVVAWLQTAPDEPPARNDPGAASIALRQQKSRATRGGVRKGYAARIFGSQNSPLYATTRSEMC